MFAGHFVHWGLFMNLRMSNLVKQSEFFLYFFYFIFAFLFYKEIFIFFRNLFFHAGCS